MNNQVDVDRMRDKVKHALQERNMRPAELARRTGINMSVLSRFLNGKTLVIKREKLVKIGKELSIPELAEISEETTFTTPGSSITSITFSELERVLHAFEATGWMRKDLEYLATQPDKLRIMLSLTRTFMDDQSPAHS